jgi:glycylpeptide N-tetradecanoyltransferase
VGLISVNTYVLSPIKIDEVVEVDGAIEEDVPLDQVRATPYPLPKEFEWSLVDVENDKEIKELYELLTLNYVEDDDAMFRFDYSAEFLKWALLPPGWKKAWHIGVRVASNKKLVAFISGIPQDVRVHTTYVTLPYCCVSIMAQSHAAYLVFTNLCDTKTDNFIIFLCT